MKPYVSIIMCVYNGKNYLRDSVESILNQTFTDFEFIVVNDGSSDNSFQMLKTYRDARVDIINSPKNLGLTKSLNIGIAVSKGKYIARMDADDLNAPDRIMKEVDLLETYSEIGVVGTNYYEIDKYGNRLKSKVIVPESDEQIRKALFKYNPFIHSSLVIRKGVLSDVGYYDENFKLAQDYELILRILSKYKGHNLQDELVIKRIDFNSLSFNRMRSQIYYSIRARVKAIAKFNYEKRHIFHLWKDCLRYLIYPYTQKRAVASKKPL